MTILPVSSPSPRDTNDFYADGDPMRWVDGLLVEELRKRCGPEVLDLGCGVGGYSKTLMDAGHRVVALDINPVYVDKARALGVDATRFDGVTIPLADASVDTVFLIEVLEHVPHPARLLAEVHRVTKHNVVITVPNNTQRLNSMIAWSHMLDVDHKNFFTVDTLGALLRTRFPHADVQQMASADHLLAKDLLGKWMHRVYRSPVRLGLEKDKLYFRLIAEARKH